MTRQTYENGRDSFFSSTDKILAKPVMLDNEMAGWSVYKGCIVLPSARNSVRLFKTLGAIAKFCQENEIRGFEVTF